MSSRRLELAGWATGAVTLAVAAGGAASTPNGYLLGLPGLPAVAVLIVGMTALGVVAGRGAGRWGLAAAPVVLLVILGTRLPGLAALAGPPIAVLWIAGAVLALAATPPRWGPAAFLPVVALVYGLAAARVQAQVGPQGDEPHYLMVADSLLRDHDLSLEPDYAAGRYRAFHPEPLAPHFRVRGRDGAIYSLHAVGLSLLVLPAYAVASYAGASFLMALLGVWLALEVRALLRASLGEGAEGVAWIVALSPPLVHYAGLIFTEIPAALIVAVALRQARAAVSTRIALLTGTAVAFLPWLNVRYAILAAALLAFALAARPARGAAIAWLAPSAASAAALALFHFHLYGFFDPRRVYGRRPELSLSGLPTGLPGLLFDQEFGLLVYAPVFALAVPGMIALWRQSRRLAVITAVLVLSVVSVAGAWPMWRGGFNPPARFLVPVIPALALAIGPRLQKGMRAGAALLAAWGLWTGAIGTWDRALVHRDRDGTAPLWRAASGAEEWTRLLPGYVLDESEADRARLTLVWALALAAAVAAGRKDRTATPAGLAAAGLGLLVAAGIASRLSSARTEGRDAVRVIGRPALAVPGWKPLRSAPAVWTADVLPWGPSYEPHRAPAGAVIGGRLRLPPGDYAITLGGEVVPSALPPPLLAWGSDKGSMGARALSPSGGGLAGHFTLISPAATTLRLQSGGPFILKDIRLERASTFSAADGLIP
ncbi:MAG TPA: hypothetical protein VFK70_13650 [Vicinamibacteria bacterium]|nr:hypothetical protein [Vicinamibacteria bacterium]